MKGPNCKIKLFYASLVNFDLSSRGVYFHFIPNDVQKNVGCNKLFQSKNYNSFQSNIACLIFLKNDLNKYRVMYIGLVLN